jgi:hypothetical protein
MQKNYVLVVLDQKSVLNKMILPILCYGRIVRLDEVEIHPSVKNVILVLRRFLEKIVNMIVVNFLN